MQKILLLAVLLIIHGFSGHAQSYKFRKFAEQEGLNNRFVYTLDQDEFGNLLVGTGEGLYIHDGIDFREISHDQGVSDHFFTCSTKADDGSIWYGHNRGLVTRLQRGKFEHFDLSSFTQSRINVILEDNQKQIWVLSQNDGIIRLGENGQWKQFKKGIEDLTLYSMHPDEFGNIWLGSDIGLLKGKISETGSIDYDFVDEIIETKVSSIEKSSEGLLVGTDDAGIFRLQVNAGGYTIQVITHKNLPLNDIQVNSLFEDPGNNLWICSNNNGLIQLTGVNANQYAKIIRYRDHNNLKTSSMKICRTDREGTVWVGTIGDGLLKLSDNYFSICNFNEGPSEQKILSVFEKNDTIWSGGIGEIFISLEDPINISDSLGKEHGLPQEAITAIHSCTDGSLWAGTENGKLQKLDSKRNKFIRISIPTDLQGQRINDILEYKNSVYVASDYGIYQYEGNKLVSHISIQSGLAHNVVKSLYLDSKGRIWIATNNSQITYIEDGIIQNIKAPIENVLIQIRCIAEDNSGNIWIGTDGLGLMKVTGNEVFMLGKQEGLYSDYCYSIICDNHNKIWVGHHGAVSKVNILNNVIEVIDPGSGHDIDFNDNAVARTPNGVILFGINRGLLRYEPMKDNKNMIEPILHFNSVMVNDSLTSTDGGLVKLPYGEYKLSFDFIGVSLKNPLKVSYQYYLDGYENDWNSPGNSHVQTYSKLGPGEYTFKVRCYNADGYGGVQIIEFPFTIDQPFWLKWWFITLCILLLLLGIRTIIVIRERNLREAQERLQRALDDRTREVVIQKELLEEKNKDITDSIQYARNIQDAMLPSTDTLNKYFKESFVYYKPRDIVSGDFYWVEQFNDFIVVSCADCTGHGVPGAFMSLIGSTLLKEVSGKKTVQSSRDVLLELDRELTGMLSKQGSNAVQDGMDIAVFDYNVKQSFLRIASANRPVILYNQGTWHEIKGERHAIGGKDIGQNKDFTNHAFQIAEGDMIYLFSDGITDQFGGDHGKKLKRSGLLAWIKEVSHLPMHEQRRELKLKFNEWKGQQEQLDDIILIGIKF